MLACYRDLWKTESEKRNAIHQGIISNDGCTENCIKLRINAGDKNASNAQDKAIADAYGNKFIIPLDFEMLDSAAPYYQAGLGNRLCYELMEHLVVLLAGPISHTSTQYIDFVDFLHFNGSVYQLFCSF